jgi:hypothetical protein
MPPGEYIMDHIRHKERHSRKVVHAILEIPVGGAEDQGRDSLLSNIK